MATRVPALIQLSDPRVAAQLVYIYITLVSVSRSCVIFIYNNNIVYFVHNVQCVKNTKSTTMVWPTIQLHGCVVVMHKLLLITTKWLLLRAFSHISRASHGCSSCGL